MKLASKAHFMVSKAISSGKLVKATVCSECNTQKKLVAHHDDYTKPLEVRWMCHTCHRKHHYKNPHNRSDLDIQVRLNPDNLKQIRDWTSGFRLKVSISNAANMFIAEGLRSIKQQGGK